MSLPDELKRSPDRPFIAGALIAAGLMVLAPSGAFTIAILHYVFENAIQNPGTMWHNMSTIEPFEIEVFAGLAAGALLVWAGIRIGPRRSNERTHLST